MTKSALKTLLRGCWGALKVNGCYFFPLALYVFLVASYDIGFDTTWEEYLFLTDWWSCYAALIMMWLSYKETPHPVLYKTWAIVLFYAFFCMIFAF